jgi:hypothetical protein
MAREEHDREDLMREATALVERVEFRIPGEPEPVVAGFRRTGDVSFFFGADPVYQFNAADELRRAYVGGKLLKAERGRLVELVRVRTPEETQLVRRELSVTEADLFVAAMTERLATLRAALEAAAEVVTQLPPDVDVAARVRRALAALDGPTKIADSPRVG